MYSFVHEFTAQPISYGHIFLSQTLGAKSRVQPVSGRYGANSRGESKTHKGS